MTRQPGILTVDGPVLRRGGQEHRILSGAIHYFRVHPELWEDRLRRLQAMGLNTIETYVAWNLHERQRGVLDFSGPADLVRFIETAGEIGLDVIVRPGPYICAEWDFGGLPAWLLADEGIAGAAAGEMPRLRCNEPAFLDAVEPFLKEVLERIVPLQSTRGGPVVAVQIENEYGSFGNDRDYLAWLHERTVAAGIDVLLVTSDGPTDDMLHGGSLPGALATANFGSRPLENLAVLERFQPGAPQMCMEFWNGWFDHWGEQHHVRNPVEVAGVLDELLGHGAHVNIYMAHGGTNHGLWNGANFLHGVHQPTVTSYDYDAPVGEAGQLTDKYWKYREVLERYARAPLPQPPRTRPGWRTPPPRSSAGPTWRITSTRSVAPSRIRCR